MSDEVTRREFLADSTAALGLVAASALVSGGALAGAAPGGWLVCLELEPDS